MPLLGLGADGALCAVALDAHARDGDVKATRQLIRAARSLGGVQPGPVSLYFDQGCRSKGRNSRAAAKRGRAKSVDEATRGCLAGADAASLNAGRAHARLGAVDDACTSRLLRDYGASDARAYNAALAA